MKKLNKLFAVLIAVLGVQTLSAQTWTDITNGDNNKYTVQYASPTTHDVFETWTWGGSALAFDWNQTVTNIPNGVYELSANAMYRASLTYGTPTNCVLYAKVGDKEYTTPIANFADYTANEDRGQIAQQMQNNDAYKSKIGYIIVKNGASAQIGIKSIGELAYCTNGHWFVCKKSTFAFKNVTESYFAGLQSKIDRMLAYAAESSEKSDLSAARQTYNTARLEDIEALQAAIATFMKTASATNPIDVTPYMANPSFEGGQTKNWIQDLGYKQPNDVFQPEGWNMLYSSAKVNNTQYQTFMTQTDKAKDGKCLYVRHRWGDVKAIEDLRQSVQELPAGQYKLVVAVKGGSNVTDANTLTLSAGNNTTTTIISNFDKTNYKDYEAVVIKASDDESLDICYGFKQTYGEEQLYYVDDFRLYYLGDPITPLLQEISSKKSVLESYESNIPTSAYSKYSNHLQEAENANNSQTVDALQTIVNNLNADIADAESLSAPYAKLISLINVCNEYTDNKNSNANSEEILNTFKAAIQTAESTKDSATSVDALTNAYNTLESARQIYAKNAVPVYPYPFDMTFLLPNTTFDKNIEGWTKTGSANWMNAGNVECYDNTFEFSMEYKGLNSGSWEIQVDAFYRYGGYNDAEAAHNDKTEQLYAILYANNNKVAVKSIMEGANKAGSVGATTNNGLRVPNAPGDCGAYFATGCYSNSIATVIADGKLKVGIKKEETKQYDWTIFDNFKLIYKGVDVRELQASLSALIITAQGIQYLKMGAEEKDALNEALEKADADVTSADDLSKMISTLQSAYDAAMASIETYSKVPAYIEKANKIDMSIAESYQTQYEKGTIEGNAKDVFHNLEVATYQYVMENFNYPVKLSTDWNKEGPVGELSDQHWSGEKKPYLEQSSAAWSANAWEISYDQDLTLPAGEYVFKVAGRKASGNGCALSLIVTKEGEELGTVNDFPEGDTGHGITVNGWASFSADSAYANNNVGRGWQWRYVKFTLDSDATVNIAVKAQATTSHQWISFCDATVQMTEDTYLEANKGGLDAPTAAANALVDTKPMGTTENEALNDALNLSVTTGAELLAKIAALEKAVKEANTWREDFYRTRAESKLVEAFERFETDFNDGANGALRKMSDEDWTTLLEAVKTAAREKDVTNNYDNFANAAKNFNDAMDAAEFAIANYLIETKHGDVTGLIKNADFTGGVSSHAAQGGAVVESPKEWEFVNELAGWQQIMVKEEDGTKVFNVWTSEMNGKSAELKQAVKYLPNGTYKLSADMLTDANSDAGSWVAIYAAPLNENGGLSYSKIARSKNVEQGGDGNAYNNYEVYFKVENNAAVVGVRTDKRYFKIKNIKLEKVKDAAAEVDNGILLQKAFENRSATSWDITSIAPNASGAEIYLNNPNAIVYANDGQVQWPNTVVDGKAASFTLTEGNAFYSDRDFAATTLNYNRELSDNWLTVCLPFDYTIPEGVKVETLSEIDTETKTFTFDEVSGTMTANTPYIIKNSTTETTLFASLINASVKSTPEAMKVTVDGIDAEFVGTYTTKTSTELMEITDDAATYDILFFGTDGQLYYLSQGVTTKNITFKPFRAYIRIPKGNINWTDGQQARVRHRNSEMTDIDTLESADDSQKTTVIYDMHGRRVTEMVKGGMYIVNGKKVIVK